MSDGVICCGGDQLLVPSPDKAPLFQSDLLRIVLHVPIDGLIGPSGRYKAVERVDRGQTQRTEKCRCEDSEESTSRLQANEDGGEKRKEEGTAVVSTTKEPVSETGLLRLSLQARSMGKARHQVGLPEHYRRIPGPLTSQRLLRRIWPDSAL